MKTAKYAATLWSYPISNTSIIFLESLGGSNSTRPGIDRVVGPTHLSIPTRLRLAPSEPCGQVLAEAQTSSWIERVRSRDFPLPRLPPFRAGPRAAQRVDDGG